MAYAWLNGKMVAESEAVIPITDQGLLLGDGCFETVRIHRGAPFRMAAHLKRLADSRRLLGLQPLHDHVLRVGSKSLVEANQLTDGLLRITATSPDPTASREGTTLITVRPLPEVPAAVPLHLCEGIRRIPGPFSAIKTTSRALEAAALREARAAGAFDAVLLNPSDRLAETTARNLFLVQGNRIRTPPGSEGALAGITRAAVLALALVLGLRAEEAPLPREELNRSEEVFVTGSGVGVLGVATIGNRTFAQAPGPQTKRIADAYRDLIDRDCRW